MKNRGKVGNKPGQPKYRTAADFRIRKDLQINQVKNFNQNKSRSMKIFNRGK